MTAVPSTFTISRTGASVPSSADVISHATSKPEAKSGEIREDACASPEYPPGLCMSQEVPTASALTRATASAMARQRRIVGRDLRQEVSVLERVIGRSSSVRVRGLGRRCGRRRKESGQASACTMVMSQGICGRR